MLAWDVLQAVVLLAVGLPLARLAARQLRVSPDPVGVGRIRG